MDQKKIFLSSPTVNGYEMEYINEAFETNWIAPLGANVDGFETDVASYVGEKYAAALSSGTAAIHLALRLAGVGAGDIVFCSSFTFSATANPIIYQNATPVFIDSERDTWNMSADALRRAFEKYPAPKAVILVHLYGVPARCEEIAQICQEHGTVLIEDAAEALGARYNGRYVGTYGEYGAFSFNGNKIITTSGGGMLLCKKEIDAKRARFLSTQARDPAPWYQHSTLGYNYRMSNICAGIGRGQMKTLDRYIEKKRSIYRTYAEAFADTECISMNPSVPEAEPIRWLSCMTLSKDCGVTPMDVYSALAAQNIETRPAWKPMHMQPFFEGYDYIRCSEDVSRDLFERSLCLPSDVKNTDEDMERIISAVKALFR